MKRSRNARYAAAALALGLALGARPALGQDQAAAPPPGVLPTCMNFSVSRDIGALRQRIRAARQAKRAPREAGLYESIVRHAQCSAFVQGDNGPCLDLAALGSNYAQYQAQCASLLARVSFWRDISAGTIGPRDIEQCGAVAATGVDANALCRRMVALWARRSGDVCQALRGWLSASARRDCAYRFALARRESLKRISSPRFMEYYVMNHLWHRTRPNCSRDPLLKSQDSYLGELQVGVCVGVFEPERCEAMLGPVKTFLCSPIE